MSIDHSCKEGAFSSQVIIDWEKKIFFSFFQGGGTGIGRELAVHLSHLGARVVISGRTESTLKETASLASAKSPIEVVVADIGSVAGCQKTIADAAKMLGGGLDAVVSNHVTGKVAKLSEFSSVEELYEKYRMTYDVNLFGVLCMAKVWGASLGKKIFFFLFAPSGC
jgi:NAD(P)-dependent dehydrogenase (short-subunit alcohol dehydrogenase family)